MAGTTKFGQMLKSKGYTQHEVAQMLGLSEAALSMKANGRTQFKQAEIRQLRQMLDMNEREVMDVFFGA